VGGSGGETDLEEARAALWAVLVGFIGEGEVPRLREALTHPSFANEAAQPDNQRLEFLGDSVLGACIAEDLLEAHPEAEEGELTRRRAALVNAEALAQWARAVRLGDSLAMGRGARASVEKEQTNVLADAVEALIAAVYLARGLPGARALVREIARHAGPLTERLASLDPKGALQQKVQAEGGQAPRYRVVASHGPPHEPRFEVEVLIGDAVVARGAGRSKRLAERSAAEAALAAREVGPE
jgi:ribonuclease-3